MREAMSERIWTCKIGGDVVVPAGGDGPMRTAVERAFYELTGEQAEFTFSGWGGELDESERACVEDRLPRTEVVIGECHKAIDDALDTMHRAEVFAAGFRRPQVLDAGQNRSLTPEEHAALDEIRMDAIRDLEAERDELRAVLRWIVDEENARGVSPGAWALAVLESAREALGGENV